MSWLWEYKAVRQLWVQLGKVPFIRRQLNMPTANIPEVERLSERVIRVLGCNPGPYTLQGTNTYLVGTGKRRLLVDAGEKSYPKYIANLQKVLHENGVTIDKVLITHYHHDHLGGVQEVNSAGNKGEPSSVYKMKRISQEDEDLGPSLKYQFVEDGHSFQVEGATLKVVYTPGHTDDHMGLYLEEEMAFFSGDCVLGEGTCVFEDLYDYMNSLKKILSFKPVVVYPGHGPAVTDPDTHLNMYISHRNKREAQILQCLDAHKDKALTAMEIVKIVYHDVPSHLHPGACGNVTHHLEKLLKEKKVVAVSSDNQGEQTWQIISSKV